MPGKEKPPYDWKYASQIGDADTIEDASSIPLIEGPSPALKRAPEPRSTGQQWSYQPQVKASPTPPPVAGNGMGGSASSNVPVAAKRALPAIGGLTTAQIVAIAKAMEEELMASHPAAK